MAGARGYVTLGKQIFIFFWLAMFLYITSHVVLNTGEINLATERQLKRTLKKLDALHSQNKELSSVVNMLKDAYLRPGNKVLQVNDPHEGQSVLDDQDRQIQTTKNSGRSSKAETNADQKGNEHLQPKDTPSTGQKETQRNVADGDSGPTLEQELARRKVDTDATEFWYYMRSELQKLRRMAGNSSSLTEEIDTLLKTGTNYQKTMKNDLHALSDGVNALEQWRFKESQSLGSLVQRRIKFLQNPENCNTARKLLCKMNKSCGFGCQLHHLTYCLIVAYSTERTMILLSQGWKYTSRGWETLFLPMSESCTDASGLSKGVWGPDYAIKDIQVVEMPIIDGMPARPAALPLAVPEDLADNLTHFHGNPAAWWIGQIVTYLTRPRQDLETHLIQTKARLNFSHPIVGVQVRRTDKITAREARYHGVAEYMTYVEEWFDTYEQKHPGVGRNVYLATDDTTVLKEAQTNFPNYKFLNDQGISQSAGLNTRYTETSVRGVMTDIHVLSLCDYLVCTFSSQVCRAAYELMQPIRGDASGWFKSLDDIYYYGGQHPHEFVAVESHTRTQQFEIDLRVGDIIHMAGNHWDGYSKGANTRTGQTGLFPSYKVRDKVVKVKMPTYPQVTPDR